jgi:hypothetical protein
MPLKSLLAHPGALWGTILTMGVAVGVFAEGQKREDTDLGNRIVAESTRAATKEQLARLRVDVMYTRERVDTIASRQQIILCYLDRHNPLCAARR